MLKKIYMVIVVGIVVGMVGCGKEEESSNTISNIEKSSTVARLDGKVETPIDDTQEVSSTSEGIVVENTISDDPFGMFLVPEEWAEKHGGVFVKKGDKLYTISNQAPRSVVDAYGVGYSVGSSNTKEVMLYLNDQPDGVEDEVSTAIKYGVTTSGDFPILEVSKKDSVVMYGGVPVDDVYFATAEFAGYTIPACDHGKGVFAFAPIDNHVLANDINRENVGVFDTNENPVEDVRNLEYGKEYIYEWYTGAKYNEMRVVADSRCYNLRVEGGKAYKIPFELTKFGYVSLDISELEPGTYSYGSSSVFEIID